MSEEPVTEEAKVEEVETEETKEEGTKQEEAEPEDTTAEEEEQKAAEETKSGNEKRITENKKKKKKKKGKYNEDEGPVIPLPKCMHAWCLGEVLRKLRLENGVCYPWPLPWGSGRLKYLPGWENLCWEYNCPPLRYEKKKVKDDEDIKQWKREKAEFKSLYTFLRPFLMFPEQRYDKPEEIGEREDKIQYCSCKINCCEKRLRSVKEEKQKSKRKLELFYGGAQTGIGGEGTATAAINISGKPVQPVTLPGQPLTAAPGQPLTAAPGQPLTAAPGQPLATAPGQPLTAAPGQPLTAPTMANTVQTPQGT